MRVLVAVRNEEKSQRLCGVFKKAGYVVDEFSEDVRGSVKRYNKSGVSFSNEIPYSLIVFDESLSSPEIIKSKTAKLIFGQKPLFASHFNDKTFYQILPRNSDDEIVEQAAKTLSAFYGSSSKGVIGIGAFELNLLNQTAKVDGKDLECSPIQFSFLRVLSILQKDWSPFEKVVENVFGVNNVSNKSVSNLLSEVYKLNEKIREVAEERFTIPVFENDHQYFFQIKPEEEKIKFGNVIFYPERNEISCYEERTSLSDLDAELLKHLSDKQLKTEERTSLSDLDAELLKHLSDKQLKTYENLEQNFGLNRQNISMQISILRKKIGSISGGDYIKNERGLGYQLVDDPAPHRKYGFKLGVPTHTSRAL